LFITSYLEIMICAIITLKELSSSDFDSSNKSDLFAAIFLITSTIIMTALPLILVYVIYNYQDKLDV